MTSYAFPSDTFPAFPTVHLDADHTWTGAQAPGAVMSLVRPADPGVFAPNVVVTETRHEEGFDVDDVITDLEAEAVARGGSADEPPFFTELNGRTFRGRTIVIEDPRAGTLAQVHLVTPVDHAGVRDVIHVVGTCSGARIAVDFPLLQALMGTVVIDTPK